VERLLAGLRGIVAVKAVDRGVLERVVEEEGRYEKSAFLPLQNEGVRQVLARQAAVALLKDRQFREPPAPTVYLVERLGEAAPLGGQVLEAEDALPHPGEEVPFPAGRTRRRRLFLAESFVLFPERRACPHRPFF
jgi:hypothetical protein